MPMPMPPTDAVFLLGETREHPMHVGGLQLFVPPEGATPLDIRAQFEEEVRRDDVGRLFQQRPVRSLATLGQWAWDVDRDFDLDHHVRFNALPQPGRVLELLSLCSRLHSTLLDRHRPLWELHVIEGLNDGRFAMYFKVHHALVDGVSAMRVLSRTLSTDPDERDMPAPWAPRERRPREGRGEGTDVAAALKRAASLAGDAVGLVPVLQRSLRDALRNQAATMSFNAPRTILNTKITGARRFAAQSWPVERMKAVGRATGTTLNDVVLAMCSGALRTYLTELGALPDEPLIAMVPVSLHGDDTGHGQGGNAVGAVMCNLGTDLADPADRLSAVHESMLHGKEFLKTLTPAQILAMSALGLTGLAVQPVLGLVGHVRPPFNLVISNVPGPRTPLYWNGARLDGTYPLSIPLDGQALNITCTSYHESINFGLIGCRRTVPHLQRLLGHLDDELAALEKVA
jgi:diacylglycerol O-acyltransferase